ncbi:hypothetical protein [Parasphingorhabdus cellanae]|uniref:Alginate export domain-containing protein n=1 Tax=Parasphingorhabdus cellanae TaxID=2806553 RepID=A0ABX7T947_9SPHN|nr:hypothetical protein [Parasphingorhabdus cellanae]QTD57322.1 hypothetical protein J4G78_07265 [Parasphingorhabdus cellanae]
MRLDSRDSNRSHVDVREASVEHFGDGWDALLGIGSVFWGVTESRHLVNIVNQIDGLEDIDEESFLGQPMIRIGTQRDWGRLDVFVMSGFRERSVPSARARLRSPILVVDEARFDSGAEEFALDLAGRYSHTLGDWDIALSGFYGTSREPVFEQIAGTDNLRPFYDRIGQIGVEAQYTSGAWLWKFEGIQRAGYGETFQAAVGGFEYTLYQAFASSTDVGILAEYLYDNRSESAPVTVFNNDLFLGTRMALNDTQDSSLLVGSVFDLENGSTSIRLEAERRLGENFQFEVEGQFFANADAIDPLRVFNEDDYITLRLTCFF